MSVSVVKRRLHGIRTFTQKKSKNEMSTEEVDREFL